MLPPVHREDGGRRFVPLQTEEAPQLLGVYRGGGDDQTQVAPLLPTGQGREGWRLEAGVLCRGERSDLRVTVDPGGRALLQLLWEHM